MQHIVAIMVVTSLFPLWRDQSHEAFCRLVPLLAKGRTDDTQLTQHLYKQIAYAQCLLSRRLITWLLLHVREKYFESHAK
jgi:hypothetical protein